MPFDADTAIWLGEMIGKAVVELQHSPGITVEVDKMPNEWVQVLPEASQLTGQLSGFVLNFPYRGQEGDPVQTLLDAGLTPPPNTQSRAHEDDGFATIWVRPDTPLVGLAHFIGDILHTIVNADEEAEVNVQFDYGY